MNTIKHVTWNRIKVTVYMSNGRILSFKLRGRDPMAVRDAILSKQPMKLIA